MYFSKIQLRPDVSGKDLLYGIASVYQQHRVVWRLFGDHKDRQRDFVFRHEKSSKGRPEFYVVSNRPPEDADGIWSMQIKPYNPTLHKGDLLHFKLRANPTVARPHETCSKRHDVVMDRKQKIGWKNLQEDARPPLQQLIHEAGLEWLEKRSSEHGFRVLNEHLVVDGYMSHKFYKKARTPVQISTLDFTGILQVTDTEKFINALGCGIGRAKGFGCGLMMVKRT